MINKIYNNIETDNISITVEKFVELPEVISSFKIAYVGKHRAIQPNTDTPNLDSEDMQKHLLIECRLFNEEEEIYIFRRQNELWQRLIRQSESETHHYIKKSIQLRNDKDSNTDKYDELVVKHYIEADISGYSILRYVKINK